MVQLKGKEKSRYVAGMFNDISSRYDLLNTMMSGGMHHLWKRKAAKMAVEGLTGEALDVATGTGDFAIDLARLPNVNNVVALDFADMMLPLAIDKATKRGLAGQANWILGDAHNLPFSDDRFICATCGFGLRNFSDKEAAIREMMRVVKPSGRVVILDIVPFDRINVLNSLVRKYLRWSMPLLGSIISSNREAYTYLPNSVDNFMTAGQLSTLMQSIGLEDVSFSKMGFGTVALHVGVKPH